MGLIESRNQLLEEAVTKRIQLNKANEETKASARAFKAEAGKARARAAEAMAEAFMAGEKVCLFVSLSQDYSTNIRD